MSKAREFLDLLEKHQPYAFTGSVAGKPSVGTPRQKGDNPLKKGRTSKKEPSKAQFIHRTRDREERSRLQKYGLPKSKHVWRNPGL